MGIIYHALIPTSVVLFGLFVNQRIKYLEFGTPTQPESYLEENCAL